MKMVMVDGVLLIPLPIAPNDAMLSHEDLMPSPFPSFSTIILINSVEVQRAPLLNARVVF